MANPSLHGDRIVVIGGGVIGLACAWRLARDGREVVVVERGPTGGDASRAAGGMLAPLGEADDAGPFLSFALGSLRRYPAWVAELEEASSDEVGFRRCGKLLVAPDPETESRLRARARWQCRAGHEVAWLDAAELRRLEPSLSPRLRGGLHLPDDGQVDNRRLHRALVRAATAAGAEILKDTPVAGIVHNRGRVAGARLAGGRTLNTSTVVLAAGAWSGTLEGLPRAVPVRPVRGQMVQLGPTRIPLHGLVSTPGAYLIPRPTPGGFTVVVGASQEEAGFDLRTDPATLRLLRRAAVAALPGLAGLPVADSWAGLRPGTPDDLPLLGSDPEMAGLVHATGHFRNGILLAPATADVVAACVAGDGDAAPHAFRPDRFDA